MSVVKVVGAIKAVRLGLSVVKVVRAIKAVRLSDLFEWLQF